MPTQRKLDQAAKIAEAIKESNGFYVINYRGLTVKQSEALRRKLAEVDSSCTVYKNNIVRLCLKEAGLPEMDELLEGPNAFVFYRGDLAAAAKAVKSFAKEAPVLELKGGYADGKVIDAVEANAIADLPTREELLARMLRTMLNPMSQFARALDLIREQKEETAA